MVSLAKECAQFMLAKTKVGQTHYFKHIISFHIERDFQLHNNKVIAQSRFWLRLRAFAFSSLIVNKAIEKCSQFDVGALLESRIIIFFQPVTYFAPSSVPSSTGENSDHALITEVKDIAKAAQNIIVDHNIARLWKD